MSLTVRTIHSWILGKDMNLAVYCPDGYENTDLPVLYFLHGRSGNETLLQWLEIDKVADNENRSRSELIREALRTYIHRNKIRENALAVKNAAILDSLLD